MLFLTIFCLMVVTVVDACGKERWVVKVGNDNDAGEVNMVPKPNTIEKMIALTKPKKLPRDGRVGPTETQVWTIKANLTMFKYEADQDYHLVLTSTKTGKTMIAEIPHPDCMDNKSPFKKGVIAARTAFEKHYHLKPHHSPLIEAENLKTMSLSRNTSQMQRRAMLHYGEDDGDDDDDEEEEVDDEEEMAAMRVARAALREGGHTKLLSGKHIVNDAVVVTGCGFFDFVHGQTGVAKNGIELHPILKISWP